MSKPFRLPFYHNLVFFLSVIVMICFAVYIVVLNEHPWLKEAFGTVVIPREFRYIMLLIIIGNILVTYIFEKAAIQRCLATACQRRREADRLKRIQTDMESAKAILFETVVEEGRPVVAPRKVTVIGGPVKKEEEVVKEEERRDEVKKKNRFVKRRSQKKRGGEEGEIKPSIN